MGKVIRCIDCQTPIRIPEVESPLLRTGNWVECRARRAIKKTTISSADFAEHASASNSTVATGDEPVPTNPSIDSSAANEHLPLDFPQRTARLLRAKPWRTVEPLTRVDPEDVLTPIELDAPPSPSEPQVDESTADGDLELAQEQVQEIAPVEPRQSDELSVMNKLLWFLNPFVKGPPRSA